MRSFRLSGIPHSKFLVQYSHPAESSFSGLDSAYSSVRPVIQRFTISNSKVNQVKAANGTMVLVPANCLPIGKDAVVVGVSIKHDSVFFASQKIKIKDGISVSLPMKYINRNLLKDSLAIASKP